MTKDEALGSQSHKDIKDVLKLALEALEEAWYHVGTFQPTEKAIDLYDEARTAIKEALAQPEQPKVRKGNCLRVGVCASEGHKIQPQRTWVGLTDEEIWELMCRNVLETDLCRAVEAKLKEKNT